MKYIISLVTLMVTILFLVAAPIFAQEIVPEGVTTIKVGNLLAPWMEMIMSAVALLITAMFAYVTNLIRQKTGIDIDQAHMKTLQQALTNAAGLAIATAASKISDKEIDLRSPMLHDAVIYVNNAAPDAIEHFGLSSDQLAEKITAKLGLASAQLVDMKPDPDLS